MLKKNCTFFPQKYHISKFGRSSIAPSYRHSIFKHIRRPWNWWFNWICSKNPHRVWSRVERWEMSNYDVKIACVLHSLPHKYKLSQKYHWLWMCCDISSSPTVKFHFWHNLTIILKYLMIFLKMIFTLND